MTSMPHQQNPVCVIVGAGKGNGAAFARRFVGSGYVVALLARNKENLDDLASQIPGTHAFACDITQEQQVKDVFEQIKIEIGDVDVLIFNAGKGQWGDALSVNLADFEQAWRVNSLGALVAARQVLPSMLKKNAGNIIFIGATASLRGGANTTAFAAAKSSQRSLAQSLARTYGPNGVHVSLIIIDAVLNEPVMKEKMSDKPYEFFAQPNDIADTAFVLTRQNASAWTFELDLRPFGENW